MGKVNIVVSACFGDKEGNYIPTLSTSEKWESLTSAFRFIKGLVRVAVMQGLELDLDFTLEYREE